LRAETATATTCSRPRTMGVGLLTTVLALAGCTSSRTNSAARGDTGQLRPTVVSGSGGVSGSPASSGSMRVRRSSAVSPPGAINSAANASPQARSALPAWPESLISYVRAGIATPAGRYEQGAAQPGAPMRPTPQETLFTTPSGNIACGLTGAARDVTVECEVRHYSFAAPRRPSTCNLEWGAGWIGIADGSTTQGLCLGGPPFPPVSRTLPYGSTITRGTLGCRSEPGFLACADLSDGHGFAVDRSAVRVY
jgi:hypothetical protein